MRNIHAAQQEKNVPPQPVNRAVMPVLPQTYQETENGDQFLLYNSSVGDPQTEIIF